jgi:hypothetical protein
MEILKTLPSFQHHHSYNNNNYIFELNKFIKYRSELRGGYKFPELFSKDDFNTPQKDTENNHPGTPSAESGGNQIWKDRYISLLENYNKLLLNYANKENHLPEK